MILYFHHFARGSMNTPGIYNNLKALVTLSWPFKDCPPVPRMYALFFHRLSILERATDHKCTKECSIKSKEMWVGSNVTAL